MERSLGLERLADAVDLVVMLEVLLEGLENREAQAQSVLPGVRHSLKHLRATVCEASEQLAEELLSRPIPSPTAGRELRSPAQRMVNERESLGRGDKGTSLAERIQTLPGEGFKARELELGAAAGGGRSGL